MRRVAVSGMLLVGGAAALLSCGDVPTGGGAVAYYTPLILPLPAVAAGDTLRDSTGRATPLRVRAFDRDSNEITGLEVTFVPTSLPADVTIDPATGFLVARDTVRSVQLVGRIGDRLQTSVVSLQIVPEPSAISRTGDAAGDTTYALPALKALPVVVTAFYRGATTPVNGIIVRYHIDSVLPAGLPAGSAILTALSSGTLRPDSLSAVDTTKTAGNATRNVFVPGGSAVKRVFISATARTLRGANPLNGSPVRFELQLDP